MKRVQIGFRRGDIVILAMLATTMLTGAATTGPYAVEAMLSTGLSSTDLPIGRWSTDISFTVNPPASNSLVDINSSGFMASFAGLLFSIGGFFWSGAMNVVGFSETIGDVSTWGRGIDSALRNILSAFINPSTQGIRPLGLFAILALGAALISGLLKVRRQGTGALIKRLVGITIISAIFVFSSSQVMASPTHSREGEYKPPVGTPGWVVKAVSDTIELASGQLVNPLTTAMTNPDPTSEDASRLGCDAVLVQMSENYQSGSSSALAKSVSSMWEMQALPAYIGTQFGSSNDIGAQVFCRQLDHISAAVDADNAYYIDAQIKEAIPQRTGSDSIRIEDLLISSDSKGIGPGFAAYNTNTDGEWHQSLLAWAACDYRTGDNWTVDPKFEGLRAGSDGDATISDEDCEAWAELRVEDLADMPQVFLWDGGTVNQQVAGIAEEDPVRAEEVRDFLNVLSGNNVQIGNAWAFVATSLISPTILIGVGAVTLVAKAVTMIFLVSVWFLMIVSLFRARPFSDVLGPSLMRLLGASLVAYGSALLLSLIVTFSVVINSLATSSSDGRYTMAGVYVAGMSPLLSVIALHFFFSKVLKLPSPVSLKGMDAWSKGAPFAAGAAVGGAMGVGGAMLGSRLDRAGSNMMRRAGSAVSDRALGVVGLGTKDRKGMMGGGERSESQKGAMARSQLQEAADSTLSAKSTTGTSIEGVNPMTRKGQRQAAAHERQKQRDAGVLKDKASFRQQKREAMLPSRELGSQLRKHRGLLKQVEAGSGSYSHMSARARAQEVAKRKTEISRLSEQMKDAKSQRKTAVRQVRIDHGRTRAWSIAENWQAAKQQTERAIASGDAKQMTTVGLAGRTIRNAAFGVNEDQRSRRSKIMRRTAAAGIAVGTLGTGVGASAALLAPELKNKVMPKRDTDPVAGSTPPRVDSGNAGEAPGVEQSAQIPAASAGGPGEEEVTE